MKEGTMLRVSAKKMLLVGLLCGLCLSTQANTTDVGTNPASEGNVLPSATTVSPAPHELPGISMPEALDTLPKRNALGEPWRFTLLLPLQSESLKGAAEAVQAGFMAAYGQQKEDIVIKVVRTSDVAEEVVSDYTNSLGSSDIMIGPLTRSSAAAIAQSGAVRLPTISLTQSDAESDNPVEMPPLMLTMGLSVEDEARQDAAWLVANKTVGKVFVVSTHTPWQRRAAKAFVTRGRLQGLNTEVFELAGSGDALGAADVLRLKKRILTDKPSAIFAALGAAETKELRQQIGNDTAIYGTAQLNPLALADWDTAARMPEMNGIRLLDIPWQLEHDHPAVMIYPHQVIAADQKHSADMERLYALGIDAFRVARSVLIQHQQFEVDGVTGKLKVNFEKNHVTFERTEPSAIYRAGAVVLLESEH